MKKVPEVIRANQEAHQELVNEMAKAYGKMAEAMETRKEDMNDPDLAFNVGYRVGIFAGLGETVIEDLSHAMKEKEKEIIKKENVAPEKAPYVDANVKGKISDDIKFEIKPKCKDNAQLGIDGKIISGTLKSSDLQINSVTRKKF